MVGILGGFLALALVCCGGVAWIGFNAANQVKNAFEGMMLVSVLVAGVWWLLLVRMSDARPRWWPPRVTQRRTESSLTA